MGKRWDEGVATMWAAWRQGLKELAQVLPAFPTSVRPVEELGGFANPTQLEVNQEKGEYQQWLAEKAKQSREPERPDRGRDLEL